MVAAVAPAHSAAVDAAMVAVGNGLTVTLTLLSPAVVVQPLILLVTP